MKPFSMNRTIGTTLSVVFALVGIVASVNNASAYSPEDPEVQEMVDRGIKHLESALGGKEYYETGKAHLGGWGEWALAGYAHFKVEHDVSNPVVKKGLEGALGIARGLSEPGPEGHFTKTNYNVGVAALLLAEVDRDLYRKELEMIGNFIRRTQMKNGAYTYIGDPLGDVSQTQYMMLALWTLDQAGIAIDYAGIPRTAAWLTRVQDVSGGWPYMGKDDHGNNRVAQTKVSASTSLAGGSAILIAGDILRMWGITSGGNETGIAGLPKAIKLYIDKEKEVIRPKTPAQPVLNAAGAMDNYLQKNSPNPALLRSEWPYYQLYSQERYESFKEFALNKKKNPSPSWYNDGVEYLKMQQEPEGEWKKGSIMPSSVCTSFAVLFLIRSTQKAIAVSSTGSLAGGYGLPKDTTEIVVNGTQIKGRPVEAAVTDLLDLLEETADGSDVPSIPENLVLSKDPDARRAQIDRLERTVRGSQSWSARRVAARVLGQSDELRVVPSLIYALSDPDVPTRRYANDGLNFLSRKFEANPLATDPSKEDVRRAQKSWREWYLAINPGYVFLDEEF